MPQTSQHTPITEASMVVQVLMALLSVQEFKGDEILENILRTHGPGFPQALKTECLGKTGATQALVCAARHQDLASFRLAILLCKKSNCEMRQLKFPERKPGWQVREEKEARNEARETVQKANPTTEWLFHCSNPNCMNVQGDNDPNFKRCPCQAVSYCCKECQVADWKEHKKFCTWFKEKKKDKAGA